MKRALLLPLQKENAELRARLENLEKRLEEKCRLVDEMEDAGVRTSAKVISMRALLRELAAAATVYQDSVGSGLEARLKAGAGLSEVLRRAEAEAGDAK